MDGGRRTRLARAFTAESDEVIADVQGRKAAKPRIATSTRLKTGASEDAVHWTQAPVPEVPKPDTRLSVSSLQDESLYESVPRYYINDLPITEAVRSGHCSCCPLY